jgi:hypothetical protein
MAVRQADTMTTSFILIPPVVFVCRPPHGTGNADRLIGARPDRSHFASPRPISGAGLRRTLHGSLPK